MLRFILLLLLNVPLQGLIFASSQSLRVVDATLDLSLWNGRDTIDLSGSWLSAEDRLLDGPAAVALSLGADVDVWTPIPVPTPAQFPNQIINSRQQRTYMLQLKGLRPENAVALYVLQVGSAARFIFYQAHTGQHYDLHELGHVAAENTQRVPVYTANSVVKLPKVEGEGILLVQTSSHIFDQRRILPFGLIERLTLGPAQVIEKKAQRHFYEVFLVLGLFVLLVLFNLALFIQRPTELASLYLCIFALCFGFRYFGTEGVLAQWVVTPTLELYKVQIAIAIFSPTLANIVLGLFLRSTFTRQVPKILPALGLLVLVYQLSTSLLYSIYFTQSQFVPQTLILLALFLVYCATILRAALAREEGALLGLLGFGMVFICHLNDFFVAVLGFPSIYLGHYSLVLLIFNQSLIVGRRFALTFDRMKVIGEELKNKNAALEEKQQQIETLNMSLHEYAQTLEQKVEEKTSVVKGLLDHIPQGVLSIGSKGIIATDSSAHLLEIFDNRDVTGQPFKDAILSACELDSDVKDQIWQTILACIDSHVFSFDVNADKLPSELTFLGQQKKFLRVTWNMRSRNQMIESILVTFLDITAEKQLELETRKQREEMQRIQQLVDLKEDKAHQFFSTSAPLLQEIQDTLLLPGVSLDQDRIRLLFVNAHTVKGASRTLHLDALTESIHRLESEFSLILKDGKVPVLDKLREDITHVMTIFEDYIRINQEKLNRNMDSTTVRIERDFVEEHYYLIMDYCGKPNIDREQFIQAFHEQATRISNLIFEELSVVFEGYKDMAKKVAKDIGREEPIFDLDIPRVSLSHNQRAVLDKCMIHLIRNALDHGIESGDERLANGKARQGTLKYHGRVLADRLELLVKDDGKGLAINALHQKGLKSGTLTRNSKPQEIATTIFDSGTSTAKDVTEVSGRGIGMSAVQNFLGQAGGAIEVVLEDEKIERSGYYNFHFRVSLPLGESGQMVPEAKFTAVG